MSAPSLVEGPQVLPVFGGPPCTTVGGKTPTAPPPDDYPTIESLRRRWPKKCLQPCAICFSPCCFGNMSHGLHACERHRLQ